MQNIAGILSLGLHSKILSLDVMLECIWYFTLCFLGDGQVDFEEFVTLLGPKLSAAGMPDKFNGTNFDSVFWKVIISHFSLIPSAKYAASVCPWHTESRLDTLSVLFMKSNKQTWITLWELIHIKGLLSFKHEPNLHIWINLHADIFYVTLWL